VTGTIFQKMTLTPFYGKKVTKKKGDRYNFSKNDSDPFLIFQKMTLTPFYEVGA